MFNYELLKNDIKIILRYYYIIPRLILSKINSLIKKRVGLTSISLYLSDKCQCRCEHCYNKKYYNGKYSNKLKKRKRTLSYEKIKEIILDARQLGAICINLFGGEPLLYEKICEIVNFCSKNKMIPFLNTNGEFLDEKMISNLKKSGLQTVFVSLDYLDKRHDKFRKRDGLYKKVINNILLCKKNKLDVMIDYVLTSERIKDGSFLKILEFAKKNNIFININPPFKIGEWENEKNNNLYDSDINYVKSLGYKKLKFFDDRYIGSRCVAGSEKIAITSFGEVIPCEIIRISFGNVYGGNLAKIYKRSYNNPFLKLLRKHNCQDVSINMRYYPKLTKLLDYKDLKGVLNEKYKVND